MPELSPARLRGKVALITGASRGIGAAIASRLSQEGAKVVVNYSGSQEAANNGGIGVKAVFGDISESQFDATFNTNVKSILFLSQAAAKVFQDGQCSIVNISSLRVRQPGLSHLCSASKAAVQTLTITMAGALASRGIRVKAIAPGPIKTEMLAAMAPEILQQILASTPLGRMGDPDGIARVVAFLVSDEASYITGETIGVGGGFR